MVKRILSNRMRVLLLASIVALGTLSVATFAAPAGWELRNGSWVPIVQPGADTPEGQVAAMIRDLDAGKNSTVVSDAKDWVKANQTHPLLPQVLLLQGDAEVARGNKYRALFSYEDLLNNFPLTDLFPYVLEREYNIADAFLKGYKRKFLGMRILPVNDDALELLDRIQDRQRGSPLAERSGILIADYYYGRGEFQEAIDSYGDFLKRYPYSQYARKAEVRRAEASLAHFHGVLFDLTPLLDGRERLHAISQAYPVLSQEVQVKALEDRIYEMEGAKELEIARYYYRAGKKHASEWYYKRVVANWPDTTYANEAAKELKSRFSGGSK